ncbi:DUF1292 domain-containing protein [Clostridium sp. MB40-C1]|uniref:DUF1292 domain-containing protein n=1 Tax=Clostridium sp. MB40-C1 TaxID=3070996 RepID=UPI0027E213B5|nr:DUF1292 domain-containing protein [Clostridium sp. MB40-C1]WMJ80954.1 DUF1292 domain-containing protein [Clostridium sp. MB40-C1]
MNKIREYTENEKNIFGKIYAEIMDATIEIEDSLSEEYLYRRKYIKNSNILKEYISLINEVDNLVDGKGILELFKNDEKYKKVLEAYKQKNRTDLNQLENCTKCACLKCPNECIFDSCLVCRQDSIIKYCDYKKINMSTFKNFTLNLTNNDTREDNTYKVLSIIQNLEVKQKYIIIENIYDKDDKYILYYYPGIKKDTYGEITDEEEFNSVASLYKIHS